VFEKKHDSVYISPGFICCSVFDMYTTLFKVAVFSSSYNLMLSNIMTVVLLLVFFFNFLFPPPPQCKGQQLESNFGRPCKLRT
jgi:hypothetical protein